ncbi:MAG: hypothetical protein ACK47B_24410 [Armatimonadota bacterium]
MLRTLEGIYRGGKVELVEEPAAAEGARVLVTFLPDAGPVHLGAAGITPKEAQALRSRLGLVAEDWDRPEMDVYDEL